MANKPLEKQTLDPNAPGSSLEMAVGTTINVQLERLQRGTRHSCTLIGYRKGRSVIVSMPIDSAGNEVPYYFLNDEVTLRYFSGREIHGFNTVVSKVCKDPFSYLHLAFPKQVERVRVRDEPRTACMLPASVLLEGREPAEGRIVDLSATGAQLEFPGMPCAVGDKMTLSLSFEFAGHDVAFECAAEIRNLKTAAEDEDGNPVQRLGVAFVELSEQDQLRITAFVYETLVSSRTA